MFLPYANSFETVLYLLFLNSICHNLAFYLYFHWKHKVLCSVVNAQGTKACSDVIDRLKYNTDIMYYKYNIIQISYITNII